MFGKLGDMGALFKQAQEMQAKMEKIQEEMENITVDGAAGAGLVSVTMTLKGTVKNISIDPSLLKTDEKEILEDLVMTAINDAKKRADEQAQNEMEKVTGGLNLPAGFKLPF
ncbi:MAG: YbaB/EbfC family nucleoid-associated protein [Pseudomonadota bacterium]